MLVPLNGIIAEGIDYISSSDEGHLTFWRWESGIVISNSTVTSALLQEESLMNNKTTAFELP